MALPSYLNWTLSYAILFVLFFGLMQFLSDGFFTTFLRVRASRGKKILVGVYSLTGKYYRVGVLDGTVLKYKDRAGNKRSVDVKDGESVYRCMSVFCVDVDEVKNSVMRPDFSAVEGFDAVKFDNLLVRAVYAPRLDDLRTKGLIVLGALVVLGLLLFIAWKTMNIEAVVRGGLKGVV